MSIRIHFLFTIFEFSNFSIIKNKHGINVYALNKNKKNKKSKITMINRILYITDLHIRIRNLEEISELIQAIETCKNVSLIVIGGDVLNKKYINKACFDEAERLIRVCSKVAMTYVLVGNHDYIDDSQFLTDKHWMNHIKKWPNVVIVDTVTTIMCGFQITCVPYVPKGRLIEALDNSNKETKTSWEESCLVFAHQEIRGCNLGKSISYEGDKWDPLYPTLISGHIHDRQTVNKNVIYPGATINQGPQNNQQKIWFIETFTKHGVFYYRMMWSSFKTNIKEEIFTKTVDDLYDVNKRKNLTNTILIIKESNTFKISEIKNSQIYKELNKRVYFVFFKY